MYHNASLMKAIKVTQDLKDKNKLFEKRAIGFIHSGIPKVFYNTENIVGGYDSRTDLHEIDGWKDIVSPETFNPETHKQTSELIENGETFTYRVVSKSPEELEAEATQKKQAEAEKLKEVKLKAYVESVLTPAERLLYYPEWVQRAYALNEIVTFKGKVFRNNVEGNINAPDKGGWTEIK